MLGQIAKKCRRCGECCSNPEEHSYAVILEESDFGNHSLMKHAVFVDSVMQDVGIPYINGKCPFLKGNHCTIHKAKPVNCKQYFCSNR